MALPTARRLARIADRRVQGSRASAAELVRMAPDAGLLPEDRSWRERVLEAERDGEKLQNAARRLMYVLGQDDRAVIRPLVDRNYGVVPRQLRGLVARGLVLAASKGHGASRRRVDHELDKVAALLARFDALVKEGVLGTDTPTVADFQIAPNLALLALATNLGDVLRTRPSWRIAEQLVPRYPLDATATAPDAWAERLRR